MQFPFSQYWSAFAIILCLAVRSEHLAAQQAIFSNGTHSHGKSGAELTRIITSSSSIVQSCNQPVSTTGSLYLFSGSPTNNRISGRITSLVLSGKDATLFRIASPTTSSAEVTLSGVQIVVEFNSNTIGTYSAQLTILTADSTGMPTSDTLIVSYNARRGKKEFQAVQQILDFGSVPPNTTATKTLEYLRNIGNVNSG